MAVDILDPDYFVTELFGDILIFAVFLFLGVVWVAAKKRLPFQLTASLIVLSFLMLPMMFDGFITWIPLIIISIGLIVGGIAYRFLDRN